MGYTHGQMNLSDTSSSKSKKTDNQTSNLHFKLDYGCGSGSYSIIAAELAGRTGRVYALDIQPLAVQRVREAASKRRLTNVETTQSDCATGLEDSSLDVILLYDTFHALANPDSVLEELHSVLKPSGILSFSDHHMKENEIMLRMTEKGLFGLLRRGKRTYSFLKEK